MMLFFRRVFHGANQLQLPAGVGSIQLPVSWSTLTPLTDFKVNVKKATSGRLAARVVTRVDFLRRKTVLAHMQCGVSLLNT